MIKRTKSLGFSAFTAQLTLGKDKLKLPKTPRILYKIKGFPEGKVIKLKRYWHGKISYTQKR